jgi:CBS domain-containing protein
MISGASLERRRRQPQAVGYSKGGIDMPKAKDLMTTELITIDGMASVAEAVKLMAKEGVRALVVDRRDQDDAYGIVTQRDIVYKVVAKGTAPATVKVRDIMSKPLVVVNPDLDIRFVARLMANAGLSRAPVIGEGKMLGIVSVSDVLKAIE